mmetsp:Transcript_9817/g.42798  ORF Transcript_9817/g.42798 Transcript_9817/m.42798 type:complete len:250 (+) Transcript_9817:1490-2239(+)
MTRRRPRRLRLRTPSGKTRDPSRCPRDERPAVGNAPRVEPRWAPRRRTREPRTRRRRRSWRDKKSREPGCSETPTPSFARSDASPRSSAGRTASRGVMSRTQRRSLPTARRSELASRCASTRRGKRKTQSTRSTRRRSPCAARSGRNGARSRRCNARGRGRRTRSGARPSRERDTSRFAKPPKSCTGGCASRALASTRTFRATRRRSSPRSRAEPNASGRRRTASWPARSTSRRGRRRRRRGGRRRRVG